MEKRYGISYMECEKLVLGRFAVSKESSKLMEV
jgi:hypothetical protein